MRSLDGRQVLVTGAGGFMGSHRVERLVAEGAAVRALVRYTSSSQTGFLHGSAAAGHVEFVHTDITDTACLERALEGIDTVFHLAALIAIPYSYRAPESYVRTNVEGTLKVAQAAIRAGVRRFVHTSTSEVYGSAAYQPMDEGHPLQGQSPYSASKIGADKIVEAFHKSFGLPAVTVRPFNTYGPRQTARAVIPTIASQALSGRPVRLGSLNPTRDFTFVDDTVDGFLRAASVEGIEGETINLGTGQETSIGEVANTILELVGGGSLEHDESRVRPGTSEVERLCSDNRKARRLLEWHPATPLADGLRKTIDWIREHPEMYRPESYIL